MKQDNLYERYNRQIILPGFGTFAQEKLLGAKVLVVGAGGLGCPALQYLVGAGVGTIGIADHDLVTLSNLHRQVLYDSDDIGQSKAIVAAGKLGRVNAAQLIKAHNERLETWNALDIIDQYDLVIDGTDNFPSRYMINDACVLLAKPLVYGAVSQYEGQVAIFNVEKEGARAVNYRHLFPLVPKAGEVMNCAEGGVLGPLAGIIGTMQAAEGLKIITSIGQPLVNRLLNYDLRTHETFMIDLSADSRVIGAPASKAEFLNMQYQAACSAECAEVEEIDATQFHLLRQHPGTVVIDVRERGEMPLVTSIPHRQIPMSEFSRELTGIKEDTILLFCQHGIRSVYAAELLQERHWPHRKVFSLKGGVAKWGVDLGSQ